MLFTLKKILTPLVLPPGGSLALAILGLLLIRRWPRCGKVLAWGGVASLMILSLPVTATMLVKAIDTESALASAAAGSAKAIVILAGGSKTALEYGGQTITALTLERVRYGAKLAKELHLPVLVTGGTVFSGTPEAELMAQVLRDSFGIDATWVENLARDTHQNAVFSAATLKSADIHTVLLVTHDIHERRSIAEFSAAGITAVPAPVSIASKGDSDTIYEFLPSAGALRLSSLALHELLGNLVITLR